MSEPKPAAYSAVHALKIPLVVDGAMILSLVVGGTIMWQKLENLDRQQAELRTIVEAERASYRHGIVDNVDRLARIEERLIALQTDFVDLKREIRDR